MNQWILPWVQNMPPAYFCRHFVPVALFESRHGDKKIKGCTSTLLLFLVGVSGFEPEASWTRTKRDTKLRHTPLAENIIMNFACLVKCSRLF